MAQPQTSSTPAWMAEAFPEYLQHAPLHPEMDERLETKAYRWGNESIQTSRLQGARSYQEPQDSLFKYARRYLWPSDQRTYHVNEPSAQDDRINTHYSHMITDHLPEGGFSDTPFFKSRWEKILAYHQGLYDPNQHQKSLQSEDEIRLCVNDFAKKVEKDDPQDACKYLMIEEYKCLLAHQTAMNPEKAATKCVKWFNEWQQCQWDQEKLNRGYNYLEDREARKHKAYIGAPNYNYS